MLFSLARSCRTSCFGICPTNCPPTSFSIKPASHPAFSAGEPFSTSTISGPSFHWRTAPPRHKESSGMEVAWQASFASFLTASKKLLRVEPGMGITPRISRQPTSSVCSASSAMEPIWYWGAGSSAGAQPGWCGWDWSFRVLQIWLHTWFMKKKSWVTTKRYWNPMWQL